MKEANKMQRPGIQSPAAAPTLSWPAVGVGLGMGALAGGSWLASASPRGPAAAVAALAFGLEVALAGWLVVDWVEDRLRLHRALTEGSDEVESNWPERLRQQLLPRYAAAGLAAVLGAVANWGCLTADRVVKDNVLMLIYPALLGLGVAAIGATATLFRTAKWEELFATWAEKQPPRTPSPGTPTNPGSEQGAEKPVSIHNGPVEQKGEWSPPIPPCNDNDDRR